MHTQWAFSWGIQETKANRSGTGRAECWEKANEHLRRETHLDGVESPRKETYTKPEAEHAYVPTVANSSSSAV